MATCPRCDQRVTHLHLVPSEVFTKELLTAEGGTDIELCDDCIEKLMEGETAG